MKCIIIAVIEMNSFIPQIVIKCNPFFKRFYLFLERVVVEILQQAHRLLMPSVKDHQGTAAVKIILIEACCSNRDHTPWCFSVRRCKEGFVEEFEHV